VKIEGAQSPCPGEAAEGVVVEVVVVAVVESEERLLVCLLDGNTIPTRKIATIRKRDILRHTDLRQPPSIH
jgi:hypothetical protein